MTDFDTEQANNDPKALELLQSVFPELQDDIKTLLKVQEYMALVRANSHYGTVLVHLSPKKITVEFRGSCDILDLSKERLATP